MERSYISALIPTELQEENSGRSVLALWAISVKGYFHQGDVELFILLNTISVTKVFIYEVAKLGRQPRREVCFGPDEIVTYKFQFLLHFFF